MWEGFWRIARLGKERSRKPIPKRLSRAQYEYACARPGKGRRRPAGAWGDGEEAPAPASGAAQPIGCEERGGARTPSRRPGANQGGDASQAAETGQL